LDIEAFLQQLQSDVTARANSGDGRQPYRELAFADIVMEHMEQAGMTSEPHLCHYSNKVGNATLRLSGYALSEDLDQLDLFVSLYGNVDRIERVSDADTKAAVEQCWRFLVRCVEGRLSRTMDKSHDAYELVLAVESSYRNLEQIRIYVLTDRVASTKNFKPREVEGKTVKLEVMDIERLHRHLSEGKPRDELIVNFQEVSGSALPCVYVPDEEGDYDYALTAVPGETLRFVYEKFGPRLLEANVRSFLSATGKVNKGIRDTLREQPERFMAYNNGIVIVADKLGLGTTASGQTGVLWIQGMQIVNGGQTTASIYFSKKRDPAIALEKVRVPAKIIVLRSEDPEAEEELISNVSRYANSQNAVKQADLSANRPFHVALEKVAISTYCPDGVSRWFYERAAGSYNVMLMREGTTPARLRQLKEQIPSTRRLTKTDVAKCLMVWAGRPDLVSLGSQKNFAAFMETLDDPASGFPQEPDVAFFKQTVAKAIVLRAASRISRQMFKAFQGNIATYLVAVVSDRLGPRLDLDRVWQRQGLSPALEILLKDWAGPVNAAMEAASGGRMLSEAAKRPEFWTAVRRAECPMPTSPVPELR
jgi:hypothetical protein